MGQVITVMLVDDHPVVRQGFRSLVEMHAGFVVVGEETEGLAAVNAIERLKPDVVLLDLTLPDIGGLEVLRRIRQVSAATRVLIVSRHSSEGYAFEALRQGAAGYFLKSAEAGEFINALRDTAAGRRYLSPPLTDERLRAYASSVSVHLDVYDTLTLREREVFALAAKSFNNTKIGERLGISPRTVETHRESLTRKLGIRTHTDLVRFALKRGILPPD